MKTKYEAASAKAIGHQIAAYTSELGPVATSYAVSEFSGASVECNATGKRAAAPVHSSPASSRFEAMNVRISRLVASPETSAIAAAHTRSNPSHQNGLLIACPSRSGRTTADSAEMTNSSPEAP